MRKNTAVIILAAGLGTRMKSDKAKVLHEVAERPMILYVVEAARKAAGDDIIVVVGNQAQNNIRNRPITLCIPGETTWDGPCCAVRFAVHPRPLRRSGDPMW